MSVRLARRIVRWSARLAPADARRRWTEEWLGEIGATADAPVSSRRSKASTLRRALGAPRDAWALRRDLGRRSRTIHRDDDVRRRPGAGLVADARLAVRLIAARPGVAVVTVVSLGLGLAVTTATFSFVNAALLAERPGVADRDSLSQVFIRAHMPMGVLRMMSSRREFAALENAAPRPVTLIAESDAELPADFGGEPGNVTGVFVSARYFAGLGTLPLAGRLLGPADDTIDSEAVVIDTRLWRERFGGTPDVVGRTFTIGGRERRIVGVAPQGFTGWSVQIEVDEGPPAPRVWLPLATAAGWPHLADDRALFLSLAARLSRDVTREQAATALMPVMPLLAEASGRFRQPAELSVLLRPLASGTEESAVEAVLSVVLFMLAPLTVLGIGCANVANLRLARASDLARDLAVRMSLGGSRWRVVRPLVIECVILAAAAAAAGGLGARAMLNAVESLLVYAPFDMTVFVFVAAVMCGVVLVTGLAPAWLVTRRIGPGHLRQAPRAGGWAHSRLRGVLVVAQVALSLALLTIGALAVRALIHNVGVADSSARSLLVATVDVAPIGGTRDSAAALARAATAHLGADPRIRSVAYSDGVICCGNQQGGIRKRPAIDDGINVRLVSMGPGWTETLGQSLLSGRHLGPADRDTQVIVVDEEMARWLDPSGQVVGTVVDVRPYFDLPRAWVQAQVVGVVENGPGRPGQRRRERTIYRVTDTPPSPRFVLAVQTGEPAAVARDLSTSLSTLAGAVPWVEVETLDDILRREMSPWRYLATVFGVLGVMALCLATAGLYAVVAYLVSLRTHEIGVRMAIGAAPGDVRRLVLRQAVRYTATGVVIGMALTLPAAFGMRAVFIGVSPVDPVSFGGVAALFALVALVATAAPARTAARIDPLVALRAE